MTISTFRRSSSSDPIVHIARTTRADGDFHPQRVAPDTLRCRQRRVVDRPWTTLAHEHGVTIERVTAPGGATGAVADGAITDLHDAVLSVWVADCAPVVLIGAEREIAVVHAGWRGLAGGIIDAAIEAFHEPVRLAVLGPAIGACCYEFGATDAAAVADGVQADPESIAGVDVQGTYRLDVAQAVRAAVAHHDVELDVIGGCTGCGGEHYSHRVRGDLERHAVAVWQERR